MIVVYGKDNCVFCEKAKDLLQSKGLSYEYIDVYEDDDALVMFQEKGLKTVPQIWVDHHRVGGYTELVEYLGGYV